MFLMQEFRAKLKAAPAIRQKIIKKICQNRLFTDVPHCPQNWSSGFNARPQLRQYACPVTGLIIVPHLQQNCSFPVV